MAIMGSGRRVVLSVTAVVVLAAWALLQWRLSRIVVAGNADDANNLLAGLDQWRGHVLLDGWTMPADSFITDDVPVAGLLATLFGLGPWLLQTVPLVLAGITLLLALWLSVRGARTRWLALVPVAVALGLPGVLASDFWLQSPMHVGTIAYCLGAFGLLTGPPSRWRWIAGSALLVLAGVGDATAFAIGTVPVAALGLRLLVIGSRRRRGALLLAVAVLTTALTELLLALRPALGAFRSAPAVPVVPAHQWLANAGHGLARFFQLTAAFSGLPGWAGTLEHAARLVVTVALVGAVAVALAVLVWPRLLAVGSTPPAEAEAGAGDATEDPPAAEGRSPGGDELLVLLGVAGIASYGVFCVLSPDGAPQATTRYLLPLLVTSAVALGVLAGSLRLERRWAPAVAAAAVAVGGACLAMPVQTATGRLPTWPSATAVRWLADHGLRQGVGTYWDASYFTLESRGEVVVRPVSATAGRLRPHRYFANDRWFGGSRPPEFLVFEPAAPWGGVDPASAAATYGPPARTLTLGPYTVLVWHTG